RQRLVVRRLYFIGQSVVLHVADHADYLVPDRSLVVARVEPFADRVFIGEEATPQRLVDEGHARRFGRVGGVGEAPAAQRDAERAKVVGTYPDHIGDQRRLTGENRTPFNPEPVGKLRAVRRQTVAQRGGAHAG